MNNIPVTLQDILDYKFTINLDMEWETIFKIMGGLIIAIVVSSIITKSIS
tara:strand:- start:3052 stop:3201 length:150 start_codon:yes stop_codon:yes gene_type:complete